MLVTVYKFLVVLYSVFDTNNSNFSSNMFFKFSYGIL